jgi:Tol biopolymer transport system component
VYAPPPARVLAWRDRQGLDTPFNLNIPGRLAAAALSPKADRAVLTIGTGSGTHLFSVNLDGGDALLTPVSDGRSDSYPTFTCDGRRVLFTAIDDRGVQSVFSVGLDTGAKPEGQTRSPNGIAPTSVTCGPGGELFLFNNTIERGKDFDVDIWVQQLDRPETAHPFISTSAKEWGGVFSPDGRWIAYGSDASPTAKWQVYVRGYPTGPTTAITDGGANYPEWNPRGNELFYQNAGAVFAVPVVNGRRTGPPKKLFAGMGETRGWDVAPDGERFLVVGSTQPPYMHVVLNWTEALKAKAARR